MSEYPNILNPYVLARKTDTNAFSESVAAATFSIGWARTRGCVVIPSHLAFQERLFSRLVDAMSVEGTPDTPSVTVKELHRDGTTGWLITATVEAKTGEVMPLLYPHGLWTTPRDLPHAAPPAIPISTHPSQPFAVLDLRTMLCSNRWAFPVVGSKTLSPQFSMITDDNLPTAMIRVSAESDGSIDVIQQGLSRETGSYSVVQAPASHARGFLAFDCAARRFKIEMIVSNSVMHSEDTPQDQPTLFATMTKVGAASGVDQYTMPELSLAIGGNITCRDKVWRRWNTATSSDNDVLIRVAEWETNYISLPLVHALGDYSQSEAAAVISEMINQSIRLIVRWSPIAVCRRCITIPVWRQYAADQNSFASYRFPVFDENLVTIPTSGLSDADIRQLTAPLSSAFSDISCLWNAPLQGRFRQGFVIDDNVTADEEAPTVTINLKPIVVSADIRSYSIPSGSDTYQVAYLEVPPHKLPFNDLR